METKVSKYKWASPNHGTVPTSAITTFFPVLSLPCVVDSRKHLLLIYVDYGDEI